MAVDVGSAVGYLDLDISGFLAGLKSAQSEADSVSKNIVTKIGNNFSSIGKSLTSAGTSLTKNVTVPLLGVGVAGLKVATDFEKGMSEVKAISGATGKQFDALRDKAIELGADTAFSAGEVAAAMTEMAKAGWSSQQIIDGMSGVLNAAAASGEGLATVATIVADAITGFGLEAKESTKVADLLTQAANSGTIGIVDLGESFKYVAPVAGALGITIEDATTAIAAMSMAGIKGSQAGTSLRTMLANLVKPTETIEGAMVDLGLGVIDVEKGFVSFVSNADGSFKSLDEIIGMLRDGMAGMTEEQKASTAAALAGKEGMSGLLSILNLTEEEYNAIAASMDNANGVATETATIMQDNLQSKVEQLGGALESLAIKLADNVIPYLQQFVLWLTNLVDKFTALDPKMQKTILKLGAIAIAAGPVLVVVGSLISGFGGFITAIGKIPTAVSGLKTAFTGLITGFKNIGEGIALTRAGFPAMGAEASKLGAAIGGITLPMAAVVAGIAVVVAAFVSLWKNNEEFRNKIIAIWNQVKETFNKLVSGIAEKLGLLEFNFASVGEVLKRIWTEFCNFLAPIFIGVFQYVADTFDTIVNVILGALDVFISIFKGDWEGAWNAIKGIFESIWNGIVVWFQNISEVLLDVLNVACGWFGTTWSETWNTIETFLINTWNNITIWFQTTLNNISTFFKNTWTSVSTFFKDIWNSITAFLTSTWDTIKNIVQVGIMFIAELIKAAFQIITIPFRFIWENCKETIISIWNNIKAFVSDILNTIGTNISNKWNEVKNTFTTIWTSVSNFIKNVWNSIKTDITNAINNVKTTITTKFNEVKIFVTNVWNSIKSVIASIVNSVKTIITNAWNGIKTATTNAWNGIKSAVSGPLNSVKSTVSSIVNSIKTSITNGFNSAKSTVTSIFNSIKTSISNAMTNAKNSVTNVIDSIKKKLNFSWSLPKLKMPHPKISGKFSLNPPSVPKFTIEWYKKAMGDGMILDTATIFGYNPKTGNFLGGGEAGSETVVGTKSLLGMIRQTVNDAIRPIIAAVGEIARASYELGYITYDSFTKQAKALERVAQTSSGELGRGDTFNFYSPKAIDEIEAAKQMKKAKRELAEGF